MLMNRLNDFFREKGIPLAIIGTTRNKKDGKLETKERVLKERPIEQDRELENGGEEILD